MIRLFNDFLHVKQSEYIYPPLSCFLRANEIVCVQLNTISNTPNTIQVKGKIKNVDEFGVTCVTTDCSQVDI